MHDLILALQIFLKYKDVSYPTHSEHDVLMICGYERDLISKEDTKRLKELGFEWSSEYDCFASYRFGG